METQRKKVLIIVGAAVALIVIAAIIGILLFDINSYKPRIETAASGATGLDIRINAKMKLSYFPFGLSAKDIHIANKGVEILTLEKLKLGMAFIPLLKKQLNVTSCELYKPTITIVTAIERKDNIENAEKTPEKPMEKGFSLKKLTLTHGVLMHLDEKTGEKTEFDDINLIIKDLAIGDASENIIKKISFTGDLDCKAVRKNDLKIDNVNSLITAEKGVIRLTKLTFNVFEAKGEGDVTADASGVDMAYKINLKVLDLDFAAFEASFGLKKVIGGKGDLHASLTMKKKGRLDLMHHMGGTIDLRGDNLVMNTMDLDNVLSSYETSQQFNLVDFGAFFIAGPLSTVGLKGYRYWDVYDQAQGGQGDITQMISSWKIKNGIAQAKDCALATRRNRIALTGDLNFVRKRYEGVTVALLDDKGCAKFKQTVTGSFKNPKVGRVSAIETLGGPIFNLYRKTKRFVQGDDCEVFYNGSVGQP